MEVDSFKLFWLITQGVDIYSTVFLYEITISVKYIIFQMGLKINKIIKLLIKKILKIYKTVNLLSFCEFYTL